MSTKTRHYRDITQGSLIGHIWHLAWPIILSQALLFLPGLYDAIWLGQLGPEAQAAAGLTMTVRFVMISVLMALSVGSGAVVARHLGARDHPQRQRKLWPRFNCGLGFTPASRLW